MTLHRVFAGFVLMIAASSVAFAAQPIAPDGMGLSKGSVFEVPSQKAYAVKGGQPGQNKLLPRAYLGAPPQVPHDIADFLPITAQSNMCAACHAQPDQWGKKREKGAPVPIPPSHYTDLRNAPGKVTDHLIGARYNCTQCHVPQMDAKPLVENTFSSRRAR